MPSAFGFQLPQREEFFRKNSKNSKLPNPASERFFF
jgi:hypothetical protein